MKQCTESTFPNSLAILKQVSVDADILTQHPCFNKEAHFRVGRIHLPIAPRCNIQCNFCDRNMCATEIIQHPGWTARLLSGDPLANDQAFKALSLIHQEYPRMLKCMCTDGLPL